MQIIIKGRQIEITPRLRQLIERKVNRLSRFLSDDARVEVTVTEGQTRSARDRYSVHLALSNNTHPIHSEVSADNTNKALDLVLDKVSAQLGRHKDRQTSVKRHHTPAMKILSLSRTGTLTTLLDGQSEDNSLPSSTIAEDHNEEIWSQIMEIRRIHTTPMNDQQVIAQMEAQSLSFYPFFNEETRSINVMYRLETGGYGLLVPALEQLTSNPFE
jgi:putative sigma-54 modulation protein